MATALRGPTGGVWGRPGLLRLLPSALPGEFMVAAELRLCWECPPCYRAAGVMWGDCPPEGPRLLPEP